MGAVTQGETRDEGWFEALFREQANRVLAYALRRAPEDADDIVSEVFTVAWRHRDAVPTNPLPWLYRTAAHQIMHSHRSTMRRRALADRSAAMDEPDRDPCDIADDVAARLDDSTVVARVLATLSDSDAEILRLWAWEQLDNNEIAYVLNISATAARVRLHRAKRRAGQLLALPPATSPTSTSDMTRVTTTAIETPQRPQLIEEHP